MLTEDGGDAPLEGFVTMRTGFISYIVPEDWGYDSNVSGDLNRHLGSHESAPEVAAAETVVYLDLPHSPDEEDNELESAIEFLANEFVLADDALISGISTVEIEGANEAYRVVYEQEFPRPEFNRYHITDYAIRNRDGDLAAVRVGAVSELVDDGTFDAIVSSLRVIE